MKHSELNKVNFFSGTGRTCTVTDLLRMKIKPQWFITMSNSSEMQLSSLIPNGQLGIISTRTTNNTFCVNNKHF